MAICHKRRGYWESIAGLCAGNFTALDWQRRLMKTAQIDPALPGAGQLRTAFQDLHSQIGVRIDATYLIDIKHVANLFRYF